MKGPCQAFFHRYFDRAFVPSQTEIPVNGLPSVIQPFDIQSFFRQILEKRTDEHSPPPIMVLGVLPRRSFSLDRFQATAYNYFIAKL
jgi:hypothetical protein